MIYYINECQPGLFLVYISSNSAYTVDLFNVMMKIWWKYVILLGYASK